MSATRTFASLAVSLDGYISSESGDMAWLNDRMRRDEDYGLSETMARSGVYILGAKTFRESAGMIGGKGAPPTYVVTHAPQEDAPPGITFFSGGVRELVERARTECGEKDVHVFGGGDIVTQAIGAGVLDELTVAVVPVLLGGGVRLFGELRGSRLSLVDCRSFPSGIVLLRYEHSTPAKA